MSSNIRDGSFEYPQHMFWLRNKKLIFNYTLYSSGLSKLLTHEASAKVSVVSTQGGGGGGGTLIFFFIRRLGPSIYRSPQNDIRNFKHAKNI